MGTTLLGVDLDESPVGGLIERLLSEEELEMLADGGREADEETGGGDDNSETDETEMGTDLVDDAVTSDDATSVAVGTGGDESSGVDTPSPGTEPDRLAGRVPSLGDDSEGGDGGWKERLRPIVLKGTVVLAVLAVVGFVAYRYLGTAKEKVSDKIGSDDEDAESEPRPSDVTGDVPEARRRAKAPSREEFSERPVDETVHRAEGAEDDADADEQDDVGRPRADSDAGALVGLAALAIVAAAVRKFGEDRPRDPLVDGPADGDE